ncbi:hypothetical protein [Auraticoccus monumenti]|uniref:Uncharacterized protein n=1 Tax=Auraticoccus monumenti TaxID=675864 RepID=A0A1G7B6Q9_9ACTN|nr:hypothetical protein [Auraticoccus monumenti]SDE22693.1 hypothetical protein SAMN04489747_2859 [Auraticoccus monumenti]
MSVDRRPAAGTLVVLVPHGAALLVVAAALRSGTVAASERVVLLTTSRAGVPEAARDLRSTPGWELLTAQVDQVLDYDALVTPFHPLAWTPVTEDEVAGWRTRLAEQLGVGDAPVRLLLHDLHLSPARSLAVAFPDAPIEVYVDDLAAWAPTPVVLEDEVAARLQRLVHLDLWPGVAPRLLAETDRTTTALDPRELRSLAAALPAPESDGGPTTRFAVVVEEDLHGFGLDEDEAAKLARRQVALARAHGADRVVVVHDPVPVLGSDSDLLAEAGAEELDGAALALVTVLALRPVVVIGCSSALLSLAGRPAVAVQPEDVLRRLRPWGHPARVPLVLTALRYGRYADNDPAQARATQQLVDALSHAVQPVLHASLADRSRGLRIEHPALAARYYHPGNPLA